MSIAQRIENLRSRMHDAPQYPLQGAVLFVDLTRRSFDKAYLSSEVLNTFLGGRGANMYLLYNLMADDREALDPDIPLIFGTGLFTGLVPAAARGNVTSLAPDSDALLDSNAGDYFPAYMRHHGYDHIVLHGRHAQWTLLRISRDELSFHDATSYRGMDNIDLTAAVERDFDCRERLDMAMARITRAGENQVLCAGIMGGPKAIWARGGTGAKMGALGLKAILIQGKPGRVELSREFKLGGKEMGNQALRTSVVRNALKTVGTPFLYKPSRVLGAIGALNNQQTSWVDGLDADNFDRYRTGMDGCFKCPVKCRPLNDMTPAANGGFGANALQGLSGNAGYDPDQADTLHAHEGCYAGVNGDGVYDRYDKGDGPEYVTLGKFGPNIGIREPEQVLRLNNILNDLGLDSASTGSAIAWAMELFQRGIVDARQTGGMALTWGNYPVIERLLFQTAAREGFGDVIADSSRAVDRGRYPPEALDYRMSVKGLFQSDPHDSRILKAFALGLAVATRGMDHLRNRATLEINARINDDPAFKTALYGGRVAAEPNGYEGKEYAVRRCEDTFAVGDAVGMCRFDTRLFNSPSLPGCEEFAAQLKELLGTDLSSDRLLEIGRNISGLERMINARRGLGAGDDTLPRRWFEEQNTAGPFKGEHIDRGAFEALKQRFYDISGFGADGLPKADWWQSVARTTTGFAVTVNLPALPGIECRRLVLDRPVGSVTDLRVYLGKRLHGAADYLQDRSLGVAVNGELLMVGESETQLHDGDEITLVPAIAGG